jgi:hypothetical protein
LLTLFKEGDHGPDDFADLRLDGCVDTDGYKIGDQLTHDHIVLDLRNDSAVLVSLP